MVEERAIIVRRRKRIAGGVRARTAVHHDEQVVGEPYRTEQVEVERIPLDCWVEAPIPARQEDDATIITRPEEVVVVGKRLKAAEEVCLRLSCCPCPPC